MKNILYLFVALFLFASCDYELENTPNTNKGTAVANLKFIEQFIIAPDAYDTFSINFDLDITSRDHFTSAPINVSYNGGEEVEFTKVNSLSTSHSFDKAVLKELLGVDIVTAGDKFTFNVPYIVLNSIDTVKYVTVYTQIVKGEDGVEKEVEKTVNNLASSVAKAPYTNTKIDYYVACPSEIDGTYTLTFTGTGGAGVDASESYSATIEDVVIERVTPIEYEVSNCMGNLMKEYYSGYGGSTITGNFLDVCGEFKPAGSISDGWNPLKYSNGVIAADGVITVEVKGKWGDSGTLVYTPNK